MTRTLALLILIAAFHAPRAFAAQPPDSAAAVVCAGCEARQVPRALSQMMLLNLLVNRADDWVGKQAWARVSPRDWSRNLRLGWEWDENGFLVNMFAHPYHGGLYLNSGRSNGLSYWESVPIAFLGSFMWEYFGETHRPSLNDFFMTSFGGIALGEVFHRISASIRDNGANGRSRLLRELAALPFDPIGGGNRALRGQWSAIGANPPESDPGAFVLRVGAGERATVDTGSVEEVLGSATLVADLEYGDPFERSFETPFDVFDVRIQISPGTGGLNLLRASGRLFGYDINGHGSWHQHLFTVNQRFDYISNPAHKFGAQSLEAGIASRWRLGRGFAIRTEFFTDAIVLGALDAPYSGAGERTYDFGPGAGVRLVGALERNGVTYVDVVLRSEFIHSVSGAEADHFVSMGGLEAVLPLWHRLGLGAHALYHNRVSRYSDRPDETREFPEVRLLLNWTLSGRSPQPRAP